MESLALSIYQWRVLHVLYTNGESYTFYIPMESLTLSIFLGASITIRLFTHEQILILMAVYMVSDLSS